jgi:hypothetical protein
MDENTALEFAERLAMFHAESVALNAAIKEKNIELRHQLQMIRLAKRRERIQAKRRRAESTK